MPHPKAHALLVGLTHVETRKDANGNNWDGREGCTGCLKDVAAMRALLGTEYNIEELTNGQATHKGVTDALKRQSKSCKPGHIFVFYWSGHGGTVKRQSPDSTGEKIDQTLVVFDGGRNGDVVDDELGEIWDQFEPGVRIVMISDSCHSATNARVVPPGLRNVIGPRAAGRALGARGGGTAVAGWENFKGKMVHVGACSDAGTAKGGDAGGVFTLAMQRVARRARSNATYRTFFSEVHREVQGTGAVQILEVHSYPSRTEPLLDEKLFAIDSALGLGNTNAIAEIAKLNAQINQLVDAAMKRGGPLAFTAAERQQLEALQAQMRAIKGD